MPGLLYRNPTSERRVIQITAAEPVVFVPDNVTPTIYQPGEFYEVPAHVARSMLARGVGRLATPQAEAVEEPQAEKQPARGRARN